MGGLVVGGQGRGSETTQKAEQRASMHGPGGVVGGGDEAVVLAPVRHGLEGLLHRVEALDVGPQQADGRLQLLLVCLFWVGGVGLEWW